MVAKAQKKLAPKATSERPVKAPPPAYFLSLTVENVRCFGAKQTLDLSDGNRRPARWTIILGDNGTGKTTLLQALAGLEPMSWHVQRVHDADTIYIPRGFRDVGLHMRWLFYRGAGKDEARISGSIVCGPKLSERAKRRSTCEAYYHWHQLGGRGESDWVSSKFSGLICYAYGAARKMDLSALSHDEVGDAQAGLFKEDARLVNPEEWLLQTDYAATKRSPAQSVAKQRREEVKNILTSILPDVDGIRFPTPTDAKGKPHVEFRTPYAWVPIRNLGLGYRSMIAWTVDLASRLFDRYPDSPDPISEPAVVMVDEIDLHMHPRWQRTIMSFLSKRFKNTQFIVTAHSPLIVQAASDANIAVLRREGDHVVIDQSFTGIRGWRVDQLLTSDLFGLESARPPEYDELLAERKKLMTKSKLTKKDKDKLRNLNARMGELPGGESPSEAEAMEIIRRAAAQIKNTGD